MPEIEPPPSRNAPCPCGSGLRYKLCHGALRAGLAGAVDAGRDSGPLLAQALECQGSGRLDDAESLYRQVLAREPDNFDALHMLGVIRHQRGHHTEAIDLIGRALVRYTGHAAAYSNLGLALLAMGRADEALAHFDQALARQPASVEAHANRAIALVRLLRHDEAIAGFERALAIDPAHPGVLSNLGNALLELRRYTEAARVFERLVDVAPSYDWAPGSLAYAKMACCDWEGLADRRDALLAAVRAGRRAIVPFVMCALVDAPDDLQRCALAHAADVTAIEPLPPRAPRAYERIRLGYLSTDFRDHAVAYLVAELLETHDRARFDVVAFSDGPPSESGIRRRIERGCDEFLDVRSLGAADLAARIRERSIDIAVDLNGLTQGARLAVLARRPAPVQVNYLGYPGTMGMASIDYVLADAHVIPHGDECWYVERVVRLPGSYQVNDRQRVLPAESLARAEEKLPERAFVFCCFNNNYKILPEMFDVWMRLLQRVDDSVLWLLEDNALAAHNLRVSCQARGIDPRRLVFAPRASQARHLARHRAADLFLDTLPYNAHTTASDALWCGLPVVTCTGRAFAGRVATSLLHAAGVPELATRDLADYEALALELALSPGRLAAVQARLDAERATCPLFDTERYRRGIEHAYATMWERHLRGELPAAFDVDENVR